MLFQYDVKFYQKMCFKHLTFVLHNRLSSYITYYICNIKKFIVHIVILHWKKTTEYEKNYIKYSK